MKTNTYRKKDSKMNDKHLSVNAFPQNTPKIKNYEKALPEIKSKLRIPSSSRINSNNTYKTNKDFTGSLINTHNQKNKQKEEESVYNLGRIINEEEIIHNNHEDFSNKNINDYSKNQIIKSKSTQTNANVISKATDFINSVIHEYLLKKEYHKTLDSFQNEVDEKLKTKSYYLTSFNKDFNDKTLISLFNKGEKYKFFQMFYGLFPCHVRKREESIKNLEFHLHIYFTLFPIANYGDSNYNQKTINQNLKKDKGISSIKNEINSRELYLHRMIEFKKYLEEIQGNFKTKEMLSYFAIPYLQDIESNPAYSHLFEQSWVNQVKSQLLSLVKTFIPLGGIPLLYEVFNIYTQSVDNTKNIIINQINNLAFDKESDQEKLAELGQQIQILKSKEESSKSKLIQSQLSWTKLAIEINTLAADILNTLKNIKTKPISSNYFESTTLRLNKYDFFLKKNLSDFEKTSNYINTHASSRNQSEFHTINNQGSGSGILQQNKSKSNLYEESILWGNQIQNNTNNLNFKNSTNKSMNQSDVFNHVNNNNNSYLQSNYNIVNYGSNFLKMENQSIFNESDEFNPENIDSNTETHYNPQQNKSQINISKLQNKINEKELSFNSKFLLDIPLIKEEIGKLGSVTRNNKESYRKIALILKELRFRLSKKRYSSIKQQTILSIVFYDLFAFKSKKVKMIVNLFENQITLEETVKLLNVISTSALGRDYILNRDTIIEELNKIMINEENDTNIRQNCLGILQKFTLRPIPQKKMIELDVLNWCISILSNEQISITDYSLEYCLALIMNLSLSKQGRERCARNFSSLLKVILYYLNSDNLHVRTFINGILFSVLKIPQAREEAKVKGLKEKLNLKVNDNNIQIKKQTEYILLELEKEGEELEEKEIEENYNDEWGSELLEEQYEDDCNLNDTISQISNNLGFMNSCSNDINSYNNFSNPYETKHFHIKSIEYFILKFETDNIEEIKKLNEYSHSLIRKKTNKNKVFSIEEFNKPLSRPITPMINKDSVGGSSINRKKNTSKKNNFQDDLDHEEDDFKNDEYEENREIKSLNSKDLEKSLENSQTKQDEILDPEKEKLDENNIEKGYTYDFNKNEQEMQKDTGAFKTNNKIDRTPEQTIY